MSGCKELSREIHSMLNIPNEYPEKLDLVRIKKADLIKLHKAIVEIRK